MFPRSLFWRSRCKSLFTLFQGVFRATKFWGDSPCKPSYVYCSRTEREMSSYCWSGAVRFSLKELSSACTIKIPGLVFLESRHTHPPQNSSMYVDFELKALPSFQTSRLGSLSWSSRSRNSGEGGQNRSSTEKVSTGGEGWGWCCVSWRHHLNWKQESLVTKLGRNRSEPVELVDVSDFGLVFLVFILVFLC